MIYLDIVRRALRELAVNNAATRRDTYQQLRDALASVLDEQKPPPSPQERTIETRLLEMTIRQVEGDVRSGVDVMSEDYQPPNLRSEQTRLYAMKATALAAPVPATPEQKADATAAADPLMEALQSISTGKSPIGHHEHSMRLNALLATLIWTLRSQSLSRGSLGAIWLIFEPLILVSLTVGAYLLLDQKSVANMPLIPFAVTGIVPWLMMRVIVLRISQGFAKNKELLAIPAFNMLTVAFSTAILNFMIFSTGMVILLVGLIFYGEAPPPKNLVGFVSVLIGLCTFGAALGIIVGSFALTYPILNRFVVLGSRVLALISSVFILSEQFPAEYKYYTLINPLAHGFQLLRSEYFTGYTSTDASMPYFMFWLLAVITLAFVTEYARRPLLQPA